jgi:hypothetical protein
MLKGVTESLSANEDKVSKCAVLEKRVGENGLLARLKERSWSTDVIVGSEWFFPHPSSETYGHRLYMQGN